MPWFRWVSGVTVHTILWIFNSSSEDRSPVVDEAVIHSALHTGVSGSARVKYVSFRSGAKKRKQNL